MPACDVDVVHPKHGGIISAFWREDESVGVDVSTRSRIERLAGGSPWATLGQCEQPMNTRCEDAPELRSCAYSDKSRPYATRGMVEALTVYGPALGEVVVPRNQLGFGVKRLRSAHDVTVPAWIRFFSWKNLCAVCLKELHGEIRDWLVPGA